MTQASGTFGLPKPPPGYEEKMPFHPEAEALFDCGTDARGRPIRLIGGAARAWVAMESAAREERIVLKVASSYRSIEYQASLVARKLSTGKILEDILRTSAYPGYSEHHSGRALDLCTPEDPMLEERFAGTPQFAWLTRNADHFRFKLTYPAGNRFGLDYEPWHWCWHPEAPAPFPNPLHP